MNILSYFKVGALKSLKLWKWILLIWFTDMVIVSFIALTLRSELYSIIGKSMITEKLNDRNFVDVLANAGTNIQLLFSSFRTGLFLVIISGFLLNVFFTGGLFSALAKGDGTGRNSDFFSRAASNFWSFMLITLIGSLVISIIFILIVGIPLSGMFSPDSSSTPGTVKIAAVILLIILPVFLLVSDYARSWQSSTESKQGFKAIGKGFTFTFRHFFSSYAIMAVLVIIQLLYTVIFLQLTGNLKPLSSVGIFLLFILVQLLFILKIYLRVWRYGCVTSMYEAHSGPIQ